jgi:hypothetical protein
MIHPDLSRPVPVLLIGMFLIGTFPDVSNRKARRPSRNQNAALLLNPESWFLNPGLTATGACWSKT